MNEQELKSKIKELFWDNFDAWVEMIHPVTNQEDEKPAITEEKFIKVVFKFVKELQIKEENCSDLIQKQYNQAIENTAKILKSLKD